MEKATNTPIEIKQNETATRLLKEFPTLGFDKFALVDTSSTRLAIDDVSYRASRPLEDEISMLASSLTGELQIYDARDLANAFEKRVAGLVRNVDPERSLIIFPGDGSNMVQELLMENVFADFISKKGNIVNVPTNRSVNAITGTIEGVSVDNTDSITDMYREKIDSVVVLDDVVASGGTLDALQAAIQIPTREWYAGALMTLSPLQNKKRSITSRLLFFERYKSLQTPVVYQGTSGIPPLNSLSTLVGTSPKSELVRSRYTEKYVEDEELFLNTVQKIQKAL